MKKLSYTVLIADDEPLALDILQHFLVAQPEIELIASCSDGQSALKLIHQQCPDIAFLDIRMPGPNGMEIAKSLQEPCCPVIVFVTAYDQFAIQAFEVQAIDYLLKPFDERRFIQAIKRAIEQVQFRQQSSIGELLKKYQALNLSASPASYSQIILVKDGGKTGLVKANELMYVEAEGNYVALYTSAHKYLLHETLTALEARLDPTLFCRIHRSILLNISLIKHIHSHFNGDYTITLQTGKTLRLSRNYKQQLERLIGNF
jgi:two-component system LytT family response regulator